MPYCETIYWVRIFFVISAISPRPAGTFHTYTPDFSREKCLPDTNSSDSIYKALFSTQTS